MSSLLHECLVALHVDKDLHMGKQRKGLEIISVPHLGLPCVCEQTFLELVYF